MSSVETKELKRRVRDIIDPTRNLGHVDGHAKATLETPGLETGSAPLLVEGISIAQVPIPKAINRLQTEGQVSGFGERKFTPMDVDVQSRPVSSSGEVVNARGKIVIGEVEGPSFCRPGDEDCG